MAPLAVDDFSPEGISGSNHHPEARRNPDHFCRRSYPCLHNAWIIGTRPVKPNQTLVHNHFFVNLLDQSVKLDCVGWGRYAPTNQPKSRHQFFSWIVHRPSIDDPHFQFAARPLWCRQSTCLSPHLSLLRPETTVLLGFPAASIRRLCRSLAFRLHPPRPQA